MTYTSLPYDRATEKRDRAWFKAHRGRRIRLRLATEAEEIAQRRAARADRGEPMPDGCVVFAMNMRLGKELACAFFHVPSRGEQAFDMPEDETELRDILQYGIAVRRDGDRMVLSSMAAALNSGRAA